MLYRIEINKGFSFIANDKFLEKLKQAILEDIQEYNTSKSAQHPTSEDENVR